MTDLKRCCEILEIHPDASLDEAKQAFRDMVSIWHPDKYCHNARLMEKAGRKLKEINWAWEQFQNAAREQELAAEERAQNERDEAERRKRRNSLIGHTGFRPDDLDITTTVSADVAHQAYQALLNRTRIYDPDPGLARQEEPVSGGSEPSRAGEAAAGDAGDSPARPGGPAASAPGRQAPRGAPPGSRDRTAGLQTEAETEISRKMKLLSETYLQGRRERELQERHDREKIRQELIDCREKTIHGQKQMHRAFTERYLESYHSWLAERKEQFEAAEQERQRRSGLSRLFRGSGRQKEFPYGIPLLQMVFIQGGAFAMGQDDRDSLLGKLFGHANSHPRHNVTLRDFYLGKFPVTVRQWARAMGVVTGGQGQNLPVQLCWDDTQRFIGTLNEVTGLNFRLPTEAEWEFAARSSGRDEQWPEGVDNSSVFERASVGRSLVGVHQPNGLGLYDMIGNIGEWTGDWYSPDYYAASPDTDPAGPERGDRKVIRGNVYIDAVGNASISDCFSRSFLPVTRSSRAGFRLAHSLL